MYNIDISNFSYYQVTVMCQQYIYCEFNVIVTMIGKPELQLYASKAFDSCICDVSKEQTKVNNRKLLSGDYVPETSQSCTQSPQAL